MNKFTRTLGATAISAAVGLGLLGGATAQDNTKGIQVAVANANGVLSYSFDGSATPVSVSATVTALGSDQTSNSGSANVSILDSRSPKAAFSVTVSSSALTKGSGTDIPAANVTLAPVTSVITNSSNGGPSLTNGGGGSFGSAQSVIAKGANGNVDLDVGLGLTVTVPANQDAGTYAGTLTLSGTPEQP